MSYNRDIRPILSGKCFACHGPDAGHRAASLRLDLPASAGGVRGGHAVIVPRRSSASALIARVTARNPSLRMPPASTGKTLTPAEITLLKRWIAEGAEYEAHWAYLPPKAPPLLGVRNAAWCRNPIDRFILARIEAAGLRPSPEADPVTLIRRLSLDLTGLPPTVSEVEQFLRECAAETAGGRAPTEPSGRGGERESGGSDPPIPPLSHSPIPPRGSAVSSAYERLVDRLLASPRYGERMAMYWLDLVRYADTVGYHGDQEHHIAPYRDYVIQAFRDDMPFDRFTTEQLAGDLLPNPTVNQRIATGYNRLLQTTHEGGAQDREYRAKYASDRVRNFSAVWLGATMGCAECHNHKYDPYTQKDFYTLQAFFADVQERGAYPGPDLNPTRREPEIEVLAPFDQEEADSLLREIERLKGTPPACGGDAATLTSLERRLEAVRKRKQWTMVTVPTTPRPIRVLHRGDWMDDTGELVEPAVPHFLPALAGPGNRATRLDLARWLTSSDHPQTARVYVNRIWYLLFGAGLCRSLDDFGAQGEWPTHPELLDWLAAAFTKSAAAQRDGVGERQSGGKGDAIVRCVSHSPTPTHSHSSPNERSATGYECGWSTKKLIKLIVMSAAYRQASVLTPRLREREPENRLFARQGRFRLPAEMIRDQALAASGLLVERLGGPSAHPYQPEGYYSLLNFPKRDYAADRDEQQYRRGVYVHWQRQFLHPMLKAFDAPSREECTAQRPVTNTPLAALTLLNDPTFVEAARALAARTLHEGGAEDTVRLRWAWRAVLARVPTDRELATLLRYLRQVREEYAADPAAAAQLLSVGLAARPAGVPEPELAAWTAAMRALLNLNETISRS